MPNQQTKSFSFWIVLAVVLIALDQVTKLYFEYNFDFAERVNVLPFFDFILVYNTGAAFSMGGRCRWLATLVLYWTCHRCLSLYCVSAQKK